MLAKLRILVPFELIIAIEEKYKLYEYEDDGYRIFFEPPSSSGREKRPDDPELIELNGKAAVQANILTICFQKESFGRQKDSPNDPPNELIQRTLDSFLARLKYVLKAPQVKPFEFNNNNWVIQYLNDDETELEQSTNLIRGRGRATSSFSFAACDTALWDLLIGLPKNFKPPAWNALLIDARGALPHTGTALVLAATALEIFIAELLSELVKKLPVPSELWNWINNRGDWRKEPSVEDQYDILLKIMTSHSLKEDNALWQGMKNLRTARNSFVHDGVASIGRKKLSPADALQIIERAETIVTKIREWIPEEYKWPSIDHRINLRVVQKLPAPLSTQMQAVKPGDTA